MRNAIKAFILCLTGAASILPASAIGADFFSCGLDGCWEVGAEAIWWKPCACEFDYAVLAKPNATPVVASIEKVKPDYEWGFRLFGGFRSECDCYFITLGWTYLRPTSTSSVHKGEFESLQLALGCWTPIRIQEDYTQATARLKHRYNKINLRGGYYLHEGCDINLYSYAGLRYIDVEQTKTIQANASLQKHPTKETELSQFDGLGFELGLGGEYHIGCGFNLVGHGGAVALLGHQRDRCHISVGTFTPEITATTTRKPFVADTLHPSSTHCTPGIELRLGVNYTYECDCWEIVGEIGYHLDYYYCIYSVINRQQLVVEGTAPAATWANQGFGGPYIGLSVCF